MMINKLILNNVLNDYFTPTIPAEVIISSILTKYMPNIIYAQCGKNVTLVAKEMSVDSPKDSGNQGSKIDYVFADHANVYMVELKTKPGEINRDQLSLYLDCDRKNFGKVFGFRLIDILFGIYPSLKNSMQRQKRGDRFLFNLYKQIFIKYNAWSDRIIGNYSEHARNLLRDNQLYKSYKYIFTLGQVLDYLHGAESGLWDKYLQLIYITPYGKMGEIKGHPDFIVRPEDKECVSLFDAAIYMEKEYQEKGDVYAGMLAEIIKSIYPPLKS